ncbi:MAG: twin-arginine translocation signal domain-containing protein, partial [Planctomycetota bacterium]
MFAQNEMTRREFVKAAAIAAGGAVLLNSGRAAGQPKGERPFQAADVQVLNPQNRVPMSFIIDDSTCLVNMAHFGIPHFATAWPDRYKQDWRSLPREIPDSFVRKFGQWCREHKVKGKYSIVPYPACVGWMDRNLPGWSQKELDDSLKLVRDFMMPDWDIHPEMISHTWVINTKTGRPYPERTGYYHENAGWSQDKSADVLADYMAYALRILKNVGLDCEGITTPGGFGSRNRDNLARATLESCRDVFKAEIPHYFRDLFTNDRSVVPLVQYASGLETDDPKCVVSIIGCTGDWFGGWDGLTPGSVDKFITEDLKGGRLPQ